MGLISWVRIFSVTMGVSLSGAVYAHEGHGNTPLHAVLHMLEENGIVLLLALVMMVALLLWRAKKQRLMSGSLTSRRAGNRVQASEGDFHDPR